MTNGIFDLVGMLVARMRTQTGQTMAEYGILIAVIAVIVVLAATLLGGSVSTLFSSTSGKL